jgi:hypothetical protein
MRCTMRKYKQGAIIKFLICAILIICSVFFYSNFLKYSCKDILCINTPKEIEIIEEGDNFVYFSTTKLDGGDLHKFFYNDLVTRGWLFTCKEAGCNSIQGVTQYSEPGWKYEQYRYMGEDNNLYKMDIIIYPPERNQLGMRELYVRVELSVCVNLLLEECI